MKKLSRFLPAFLLLLGATTLTRAAGNTATPIQHLVVIFQENVSFDHYFGTYPYALNTPGQPAFHAKSGTPAVNGLLNGGLLTNNPNSANPKRLDRIPSQIITCDQDHGYTDEQKAYNHGAMDKFVETVAGGGCTDKSIVMDYYDGNVVTALWNYAQHFAMSDNSFSTGFGPSTVGALNLISGQTHGATGADSSGNISNGTVIGDPRPPAEFDDCTIATAVKTGVTGTNVGDLLNKNNVTWGWFQGGFTPSSVVSGAAVCHTSHMNVGGATVTDYIPHHEPFQYFQSTHNQHHLPATGPIGQTDQANHQYDLTDFFKALGAGYLPAVSFLKAAAYQDGHAGYSDPLDEQTFLVNTINQIEKSPLWKNTAIIVLYDDSDGWYDHAIAPVVIQSATADDALTGSGSCGTPKAGAYPDRCGYGPRQPLVVISPWARQNFVDHGVTDQSSVLRFIEDNWNLGRIGNQSTDAIAGPLAPMFDFSQEEPGNRKVILDPSSGLVVSSGGGQGGDDQGNDNDGDR
jgi:phospholipase C